MVCDAHPIRGVDFLDKQVPGEYSIGNYKERKCQKKSELKLPD
jgi:hypothetical protein